MKRGGRRPDLGEPPDQHHVEDGQQHEAGGERAGGREARDERGQREAGAGDEQHPGGLAHQLVGQAPGERVEAGHQQGRHPGARDPPRPARRRGQERRGDGRQPGERVGASGQAAHQRHAGGQRGEGHDHPERPRPGQTPRPPRQRHQRGLHQAERGVRGDESEAHGPTVARPVATRWHDAGPVLAILLGLGSSLSWGVADFCGGLASRRSRVLAVVLLSQAAGLALVLLVVALRGGGPPPARDMALGAAAGASGAVGLAAFYRALSVGAMSLVAPIAALGVIVPVATGLAGGDRPGALSAAGAVVAVGGAVLAGRAPGPASRRGLRLAALAAICFGGFFALLAPAADRDPLWAVCAARFASVPLLVIAAVVLRQGVAVGRADLPLVVAAGLLDASANISFAAASREGLLSVVAVLSSLYPVATVVLARTVLGERLGRAQALGVGAALTGVGLIALGAG